MPVQQGSVELLRSIPHQKSFCNRPLQHVWRNSGRMARREWYRFGSIGMGES
jgi:hypothetical protein